MNGWNDFKMDDKMSVSGRPVSVASETVKQQVDLFSRGHPQACGQVDHVCCEAGGLCRKIRHKQFL